MRIDSHHHFYLLEGINPTQNWSKKSNLGKGNNELDLEILIADFGPEQIAPLMRQTGIDKTILVNMSTHPGETEQMSKWYEQYSFIAGLMIYVDLRLDHHAFQKEWKRVSAIPGVKGIRIHIPDFYQEGQFHPNFKINLLYLSDEEVPVDLSVRTIHLATLIPLLNAFPNLHASIVHGGKPNIIIEDFNRWKLLIQQLADYPNIVCKLSGLINNLESTNLWHQNWKQSDIKPYVRHLLEIFGVNRVMYGSDWPICTIAGGYQKAFEAILHSLPETMHDRDKDNLFGGNAVRFYGLD